MSAQWEPVTPPFKLVATEQSHSLGNRQLRRQHSVMIEGGMIPRARVMDQHMIDRYLMGGLLDLAQHRAAERVLELATIAGIWPTGINWHGSGVKGERNYVPYGAFPFGRALVRVKRRYGRYHVFVLLEVVCYDVDVHGDDYKMQCLTESLGLLSRGGGSGPLRKLRAAADKKKGGAHEGAPVAVAS